jgi:hypothetical protein
VSGGGGLELGESRCEVWAHKKDLGVTESGVDVEVACGACRDVETTFAGDAAHTAGKEGARCSGTTDDKDHVHGIASSRSGANSYLFDVRRLIFSQSEGSYPADLFPRARKKLS